MARRDSSSPLDLPRQCLVTVGWLLMLLTAWRTASVPALHEAQLALARSVPALAPVSLAPVSLAQLLRGWLGPQMSLLAPDAVVWWVLPVVLLGMLGYTVSQWRADHTNDPHYQCSGWWLGLAMVLVGSWLWLLEAHQPWLALGAVALATVLTFLGVRQLAGSSRSRSLATAVLSGLGPEALLGSLAVGLCWLVNASLSAVGTPLTGFTGQLIGLLVMLVYVVLAGLFIRTLGPRVLVAAVMAWWLGSIAWGRLFGHPRAQLLGWGSAAAAIMVLFLTLGSLIPARRR